jgi:hypothetical protein
MNIRLLSANWVLPSRAVCKCLVWFDLCDPTHLNLTHRRYPLDTECHCEISFQLKYIVAPQKANNCTCFLKLYLKFWVLLSFFCCHPPQQRTWWLKHAVLFRPLLCAYLAFPQWRLLFRHHSTSPPPLPTTDTQHLQKCSDPETRAG